MPSIKTKKINYESQGFVRRLLKKGSSFRSLSRGESLNDSFTGGSSSIGRFGNSEGSKWRPRKNKFELLDCDDDESLHYDNSSSWNTENATSSMEIEMQEYKQGIMFEQKITTLKKTPLKMRRMDRKRELTPIKPPCNDTSEIRALTSSTKKAPQKKQRQEAEWSSNNRKDSMDFSTINETAASDDPFFAPTTDPFGFEIKNNAKKPSVISRNSSYNSVVSNPKDFSSKEQTTRRLTTDNLVKMDSTLDTITNSTPKKNSTTNGLEKLVKERKFYQFAVDEDKASTVVESTIQLPADYPDGNYSIDEISCDETSQGTRIQHTEFDTKIITTSETAQDILATSSHSRKHAIEVKEFDAFFPSDIGAEKGKVEKFDEFFPPSIGKDSFFPDFAGEKETTQHIPKAETDISSFGGSDYFMSTNSLKYGSASIKSLAYSVSPAHKKKSAVVAQAYSVSPAHKKKSDVVAQAGRQPLTLKNSRTSGGKKMKDNEWIVSESVREQEANLQFDEAFARPPSSKKKRHSSISSSNYQPPPADPFEAPPKKVSAKENFSVKPNRHEDLDNNWGTNQNKQQQKHQQILRRADKLIRKSVYDQDFDSDEDDDGFDDVAHWERPAPTSIGRGVYASERSINRARVTRHSQESYNRQSRNQYIDDNDDDAISASGFSVGAVSRASGAGSRSKPLGMPSNAIVASMLFQTQYDIDQNDVENKINAFDQENSRQRRIRTSQGGIPDAVSMDDDHMTTVSSFSDATSAYMQESWRKPSRDLLNHFTSARAIDMDYRQRPQVRTSRMVEPRQGLYEA